MVWVHCRKWSYILGEARQREEEKSGAKQLHMLVKEKKGLGLISLIGKQYEGRSCLNNAETGSSAPFPDHLR